MNHLTMYRSLVASFLPPTANLYHLEHPHEGPALLFADIDSDGEAEIVSVYCFRGDPYLLAIKRHQNMWYRMFEARGKGVGVRDLISAPIMRADQCSILIGWQMDSDADTAELDLMHWSSQGFLRIVPEGMRYTYLQVEDMQGQYGKDGICELGLWTRDTDSAFRVEAFRWRSYALVHATDVYPYYFQRVARYYDRLAKENPDTPLYRSYWEEAVMKTTHAMP